MVLNDVILSKVNRLLEQFEISPEDRELWLMIFFYSISITALKFNLPVVDAVRASKDTADLFIRLKDGDMDVLGKIIDAL